MNERDKHEVAHMHHHQDRVPSRNRLTIKGLHSSPNSAMLLSNKLIPDHCLRISAFSAFFALNEYRSLLVSIVVGCVTRHCVAVLCLSALSALSDSQVMSDWPSVVTGRPVCLVIE